MKLDPALVRSFLLSLRNYSRDDLTYQKMLIKAFVDRIYLYDDHFTILLSHSGRKGKATKNEVREVERYFDQSGSITAEYGVPITIETQTGLYCYYYSNSGESNPNGPERRESVRWTLEQRRVQAACARRRRTADREAIRVTPLSICCYNLCPLIHSRMSSCVILPSATPSPSATTSSSVASMRMPLSSRKLNIT